MDNIAKKGEKEAAGKLRYDLLYLEAIKGIAEVNTYALKKYTPNSWQNVEDGINKHFAALMRHLISWKEGEDLDKESGLSHMKHVLANAMFLLYHETHKRKKRK